MVSEAQACTLLGRRIVALRDDGTRLRGRLTHVSTRHAFVAETGAHAAVCAVPLRSIASIDAEEHAA